MILVLAAFLTVYVVWGSTYLAIRFAIETLPPLLMAGVRFVVAGTVLYAVLRVCRFERPTLANWRAAAAVGALMLLGGNGLVCWAEQYVASGLAALLVATVPLWLVVFDWQFHGGSRPTTRVVVGLLAGLFGVLTLVGPGKLGGERINALGAGALLMACVLWAIGSLCSRRANLPRSAFVATAMEMCAGGVGLVVVGTIMGEWGRVDFGAISAKSLLALGYLSVFGSILALTAYTWLLRVSTPARVATYAYVNPVVAMTLGYALADEPLSPRVVTAASVILAAVVLITTSDARRRGEGAHMVPAAVQPQNKRAYAEGAETAPVRDGRESIPAASLGCAGTATGAQDLI